MDLLIKNGNVYDVDKDEYLTTDVMIKDTKIVEIGSINANVKTIYADNKYLFPGFIDAHSHLGMWEDIELGNDANECVDPITPHLFAIDGFNPFDKFIDSSLNAGFSTLMITPGSGNVVCGQASIIKTFSKNRKSLLVKKSAALKIALGENPISVYKPRDKSPSSRMSTAYIIENYIEEAIKYLETSDTINQKYEVMRKVLNKEIPIKIHCHKALDILTVIRIMEKYDFLYTLDHCTEGYLIADILKNIDVPLLLGPMYLFEGKMELQNSTDQNVIELNKISNKVCITSDHPFSNICYMTKTLGLLVKDGLAYNDAIRMITVNPAKAIGLGNELGKIDIGYLADINIFTKDPLEYDSNISTSIVNGEIAFCKDGV